jgi:hypothetical protein
MIFALKKVTLDQSTGYNWLQTMTLNWVTTFVNNTRVVKLFKSQALIESYNGSDWSWKMMSNDDKLTRLRNGSRSGRGLWHGLAISDLNDLVLIVRMVRIA